MLSQAVEQCVAECEFFPTVAKVREKVTQIETPQWDTAADAWSDVMSAMKAVGYYGQPKFENPLTARLVFSMDWQTLCSSENVVADRAHFMKMYEQLVEREKAETKLLPSTKALRTELTENHERRQISGATEADEQTERVGTDGVRPSGTSKV